MNTSRTRDLVTAGLIASLLSASAFITIPIGTVPVTLQVFFVILAALLLEPVWALAALATYVLLGAAGLPVFSGANGGLGVITGPTGGYLIGFLVGAFLGAAVRRMLEGRYGGRLVADIAGAATVIAVTYIVGTPQLAAVTGMPLEKAIAVGVLPFIGLDIAKAAIAVVAVGAVRRARGEVAIAR